MRVMAIDYGDARTGIAVSDLLASLCGDAFTIAEWDPVRLSQRIAQEVRSRGVERLVLGLPRNMDGTEGPRAEKTRAFQKLLEAETGLEVQLWDERRTSVDAHQILHAAGKKARQHKRQVDAVAASLILEAYLGTLH